MSSIPWLNVELTNRCNGTCWFCGRHKARQEGWETGDIDIKLFEDIVFQFTKWGGSILQFNRDGEALLYDKLSEVGLLTEHLVTNIVTNGKLLWERRHELKKFDTVTVSVIKTDFEQFENVRKFTEWTKQPKVYIKFLGNTHNPDYEALGLKTMRRVIHSPGGDWAYQGKGEALVPELGICLDFLMKPSIDWAGRVFICNRYDPELKGMIGDIKKKDLRSVWNSPLRTKWLEYHLTGHREKIPFCNKCQFWGIPRYE